MKRACILSLAAGIVASATCGVAQSVTVNSSGGADYTSISLALAAVQANATGPDVITIQNAGPFLEPAQLAVAGDSADSDLIIQASPGIRPVVISNFNGDGAILIQKNGNTTVKDLILIPELGTPATRPQAAILVDDEASGTGFFVQLQNLLITSNNGSGQPYASLDGLTSPTGTVTSFRDEGVLVNSHTNTSVHRTVLTDVIVSGLNGDQGSDGIRGFPDGAAGSEFTVGPGCVVSYCTNLGATAGAFQPGGDEGDVNIVKIAGTAAKPVKLINNNMNGVQITGTTLANSRKTFSYAIIANNTRAGVLTADADENLDFANVTIANNGGEAIDAPATFGGTPATVYTAINSIFAGNGVDGPTHVIDVSSSGNGTMTIQNSAVVLNGPYKLDTANFDNDGLDDNTPTSNVTKTNVISSDPQFSSLNPISPNFATVSNSAYATAGSGGTPLSGGGAYNPAAAVADWNIY